MEVVRTARRYRAPAAGSRRGGAEISQVALIRLGAEWPYAAVTSETDTWIVNVETGALRHLAAKHEQRRGPAGERRAFLPAGSDPRFMRASGLLNLGFPN